jgi:hypothetical protein
LQGVEPALLVEQLPSLLLHAAPKLIDLFLHVLALRAKRRACQNHVHYTYACSNPEEWLHVHR